MPRALSSAIMRGFELLSLTTVHLHVLGICGTFMGGIAVVARALGHTVTGCDAAVYPPMSTQLAREGIDMVDGYDPSQLDGLARGADLFVVGNVVSRGNPLMEAILDQIGRASCRERV